MDSSGTLNWQKNYSELQEMLLLAHAEDDKLALISLYTMAANAAETHSDVPAARFYLTSA